MNRLFICAIILFLISVPVFSQEQGKGLLELNGNDWLQWDWQQKFMFINGFVLAQAALSVAIVDDLVEVSEEDKQKIINFLFLEKNTGNITANVEYFYKMSGRLDLTIWNVIYMVYDKDWWNWEKEPKKEENHLNPPLQQPEEFQNPRGRRTALEAG